MYEEKITALRMERQLLVRPADEAEYSLLYRDTQPGVNVYWNGFGQPPSITFRAGFDDIEFNRKRQAERKLIKGRFGGGNLGWIMPEALDLFMALYRKPIASFTGVEADILELIEREGPMNIQTVKELTGLLVKQITPALHRLQEAFLVYEDQYDGGWDRGWYRFAEMFPEADGSRYTRIEALQIILKLFAYRNVVITAEMAKSFYKLPLKDIKAAIERLVSENVLVSYGDGLILKSDAELLPGYCQLPVHSVYALHRNDFLYKSNEHILKDSYTYLSEGADYDCEPLQYLLIDGVFHGAVVGHFRNGPYDLNDIVCDLADAEARREEIITAAAAANYGRTPLRFNGKQI